MPLLLFIILSSSTLFAANSTDHVSSKINDFHDKKKLTSYEFMVCSWVYEGFADYQAACIEEELKD